ncbi:MAG: Xaa-Pro peptidase family protein [Metallosphaera sp.]
MDYQKRIKKVKDLMKEDYIILGPGSNLFYLTGFTEEPMERPILLIIGENDYMLVPKMYEEQLSSLDLEIRTYQDGSDPYSLIDIKPGSSVAVDDSLWSIFLISIIHRFSPSRLTSASTILGKLRSVKDENEIQIMGEGLTIAENSFLKLLEKIKEGQTECEISKTLEVIFFEYGVSPSFSTILTSGPNTSMPHLRCTERKVKIGDPIIVDFGIKYKGYSTDTTRVLTIGRPSDEVKKIWAIVDQAVRLAEESWLGITGKEIDDRAREHIKKTGYGDLFIHRTGHGIGIDVHEEPYISQDNHTLIPKNSVFTIEPGIYIPGKFGIRIENMVLMRDRVTVLNKLSEEIYEI